jgi:hypothetical protein
MTTLRPFVADDLFKFNHINLDPLTETYSMQFYTVRIFTSDFLSSLLTLLFGHSNILQPGLGFAGLMMMQTGG